MVRVSGYLSKTGRIYLADVRSLHTFILMERKISKPTGNARLRKSYRLQKETIKDIDKQAQKYKFSPSELIEYLVSHFKKYGLNFKQD